MPDRHRFTWLWIGLLMAIAVYLRFGAIGKPPLWGDEAAVYWRICGTYQEFLQILRNDGFAPLHYELYYVLSHLFVMTPGVMRFVPALAGVLMVPAIYFLASQLVSRRTALTVATFAAVSAHLGWHARDAKMYMHFWLFGTLSMGCLLWWLRERHAIAWWCWVACSVAMVGLHSLGWGIIAIQPLLFAAMRRPTWRSSLMFVIGLACIAAGPVYYYLGFNRWTENIANQGWQASGIAWIEQINSNQSAMALMNGTIVHYLFSYDFPPPLFGGVAIPWTWVWNQWVPPGLGVLVLISLFPWPTRERGRGLDTPARLTWWRSYLAIGAWALLPAYGFYCATFSDYAWPGEWIISLLKLICPTAAAAVWGSIIALAGFYCCCDTWKGRSIRLAQWAGASAALVLLAYGIALALSHRPPGPLWISRYLSIIWPAFAIGVITLLMRLPKPLRWSAIALLLSINAFTSFARQIYQQEPPIDLLAADVLSSSDGNTQTHLLGVSVQGALASVEGRYYLLAPGGVRMSPDQFRSGILPPEYRISDAHNPEQVVAYLQRAPHPRRLIAWSQWQAPAWNRPAPANQEADTLLPHLPAGWAMVGEQRFPYSSRWAWGLTGTWCRREYEVASGDRAQ